MDLALLIKVGEDVVKDVPLISADLPLAKAAWDKVKAVEFRKSISKPSEIAVFLRDGAVYVTTIADFVDAAGPLLDQIFDQVKDLIATTPPPAAATPSGP